MAFALQGFGFRFVPVRPGVSEVPAIVDACLALHSPALWIQQGIDAEAAAQRARDACRTAVMGRCLHKDYVRLFST
jgi:predicted CoA-binding protein